MAALASEQGTSVASTGKRSFFTDVKSNVDKPRTAAEKRGEGEHLDLPEGGYDDETAQVEAAWGDTINEQQHKLKHNQSDRLEDPTMKQRDFGSQGTARRRQHRDQQPEGVTPGAFQDQTANVPTKESEV